jgi:hypothetical protein
MGYINAISLLAVVALAFATDAEAACNQTSVEKCVQPILSLLKPGNLPDEKEWNKICSLVSGQSGDIEGCLKTAGCKDTDEAVIIAWIGMKESFSYLCNDEMAKKLLKKNKCIRQHNIIQANHECSQTFLEAVKSNPDKFCDEANTYLGCIETATKSCGKPITKIYSTFTYKFLEPSAKKFSCTLDPID